MPASDNVPATEYSIQDTPLFHLSIKGCKHHSDREHCSSYIKTPVSHLVCFDTTFRGQEAVSSFELERFLLVNIHMQIYKIGESTLHKPNQTMCHDASSSLIALDDIAQTEIADFSCDIFELHGKACRPSRETESRCCAMPLPAPRKFCRRSQVSSEAPLPQYNKDFVTRVMTIHRAAVGREIALSESAQWGRAPIAMIGSEALMSSAI